MPPRTRHVVADHALSTTSISDLVNDLAPVALGPADDRAERAVVARRGLDIREERGEVAFAVGHAVDDGRVDHLRRGAQRGHARSVHHSARIGPRSSRRARITRARALALEDEVEEVQLAGRTAVPGQGDRVAASLNC